MYFYGVTHDSFERFNENFKILLKSLLTVNINFNLILHKIQLEHFLLFINLKFYFDLIFKLMH